MFFSNGHALKTGFKLLKDRVVLYRNDLKGKKNYFKLVEGFELSRVQVAVEGKITGHL